MSNICQPCGGARMKPSHEGVKKVWQPESVLFPPLPEKSQQAIELLPTALERVWPLSKQRLRQLPSDIRDLSRILTSKRAGLRQNYWSRPAFISAYLYYFLPWNLVRFCRLMPALSLGEPNLEDDARPQVIDAGAGPFSATIALWISRPELRELSITAFGYDSIRQPLELGKKIFASLAEILGEKPWALETAVGPLEALPALLKVKFPEPEAKNSWLCLIGNVLNEIRPAKGENEEGPGMEKLERLLGAWAPIWENGTRLLFMEPGTRLGGTVIMRLREVALELGLTPEAPCTHSRNCPLHQEEGGRLPSSWCHFVFSAQDVPDWLRELSRKAGRYKISLTLSPLLLSIRKKSDKMRGDAQAVRVVSQTFPTPDTRFARYACYAGGLGLLQNARNLLSGSLSLARQPAKRKECDEHSGASVLQPYSE